MLYIGLLLSALNRLPVKLPQKGTARKHKGAESTNVITFADVAGVDEAKEELQEIVVRGRPCIACGGHSLGACRTTCCSTV